MLAVAEEAQTGNVELTEEEKVIEQCKDGQGSSLENLPDSYAADRAMRNAIRPSSRASSSSPPLA